MAEKIENYVDNPDPYFFIPLNLFLQYSKALVYTVLGFEIYVPVGWKTSYKKARGRPLSF